MLKIIVESHLLLYVMIGVTFIGVLGQVVDRILLKRMIKEAENIHTSHFKLMKLVKAKFEHAIMRSDSVKNVGVFVDKYLYEHRIMGMRLCTWQSIGIRCLCAVLAVGVAGAMMQYLYGGMSEEVFQWVAWTGVAGVLLFLIHSLSGAKKKEEAVRTYMVDYLENVCAHRCEKMAKREKRKEKEKQPIKQEELSEEMVKAVEDAEKEEKVSLQREEKERRISQEIRIREILEEFLA